MNVTQNTFLVLHLKSKRCIITHDYKKNISTTDFINILKVLSWKRLTFVSDLLQGYHVTMSLPVRNLEKPLKPQEQLPVI